MRKYINDKLAAEMRKAGIPVHSVNYINVETGNGERKGGYTVQRRTPERDAEIQEYARKHPNVVHAKIAKKFGHGQSTTSKIIAEAK